MSENCGMQIESGVSLKPYNSFGLPAVARTLVRVASDGTRASVQVSGHSYMGAPAQESFRIADGRAIWDSTSRGL